jgi:hypothetical protein
MTAPPLSYRVPRAPEWVYERLAGRKPTTPGATEQDEDLDLEERIERSTRHSLDGYDDGAGR